ncbi:polysaccharide deacetylase family protein [Sphingobacterium yanglingense]|uniref:Peptidoglycan/xylan/chitin deacetylase (PgdA/CDA1 family) n=1 Tax=Sphingobacterium yanglingense TaxID=1437280 RepID=A0A4R6WL49_9SPHI|nr:polysaccharide deacetylase family protein [Sphingobacterium yanglingense]TDQ79697.1 peptidoglycan/xylan/chitin deacetylase (PgdA/CDA1 family) [Sphingobacterium yanglingense]
MYFVNAPFFLRWMYPNVTWNRSRLDKKIYLTFDDGPIPEITPWILDLLQEHQIKATFFCVGENIVKHPTIYQRLILEGHRIGNHTFNHLKGWDTADDIYFQNIELCQQHTQSNLFRPPYARATKSQINLLNKEYELIYYDVLSGDFDLKLSPEQCYKNVLKHTKNGSIIVFHDNLKAIPRVKYALPRVIAHFLEKGYTFDTL